MGSLLLYLKSWSPGTKIMLKPGDGTFGTMKDYDGQLGGR